MSTPIFKVDLDHVSRSNQYYRRVLFTTPTSQLVVMKLQPGEEIGLERHPATSQFIRIEVGRCKVVYRSSDRPSDGSSGGAPGETRTKRLKAGDAVVIPPNTWHNVINSSPNSSLRLYTVYSFDQATGPEHAVGLRSRRREESE